MSEGYPDSASILAEVGQPAASSPSWGDDSPAPSPAPSAAAPAPAQEAAAPAPSTPKEWTLNVRGKDIRTSDEGQLLKWAQQGYDYSQSVQALNQQRTELEGKYKGFDRYSSIDQYARENPQWWQHVEQQWQNRANFGQQSQMAPEVQQAQQMIQQLLDQRLNPIQEAVQQWQNDKLNAETQAADSQLRDQVESIRKEYPNLDFGKVDATGKSLEAQVIEHGLSRGIHDFTAAFRDFYWKEAVALERSKAKEEAAKEFQRNRQNGILSQTKVASPTTPNGQLTYNRNGSYGSDISEALRELGIS